MLAYGSYFKEREGSAVGQLMWKFCRCYFICVQINCTLCFYSHKIYYKSNTSVRCAADDDQNHLL